MKLLRLTAVLLCLSVVLSLLPGSAAIRPEPTPVPPTVPTEPTVFVPPTVQPTPPPTTEAPTEPSVPSTSPTTEGPTEPPTEPFCSQEVTVGDSIPGISAKMAFVFDCSSQSCLYMKSEATAKLYPASITKLVNVYTALQFLDKDAVVTVDADMLSLVPADTSQIGLKPGQKLTVENLIKGVLVSSGSDAAHVLAVFAARFYSGDPEMPAQEAENFHVNLMNRQIPLLLLQNTHFTNCDGYPDYYHYTCMSDLITVACRCLDTPLIRDTVKNPYLRMYFTDGSSRRLASTNLLLRSSSSYYRKEACGLKTGTTDDAGACLLSAFYVNESYLIIGVFGCPSYYSRYDNAIKLFKAFRTSGA